MLKQKVIVTKKGAGLPFMASDLKALPPAKEGQIIEVKGDGYAQSLVDDGYVEFVVEEAETAVTEPGDDFTKISGIGAATAKKLVAAGVTTYAALAEADMAELTEAAGLPEDKLAGWQESAAELIGGD